MKLSVSGETTIKKINLIEEQRTQNAEASIVALSGLCEGFTDIVLQMHIERAKAKFGKFELLLLSHASNTFYDTWDSRLMWLSRGFGVTDPGSRVVQNLRTLVELRNAIVHGNGSLSQIQTQKLAKQLQLERHLLDRLDVTVEGRKYTLGQDSLRRAKDIARQFIMHVDAH